MILDVSFENRLFNSRDINVAILAISYGHHNDIVNVFADDICRIPELYAHTEGQSYRRRTDTFALFTRQTSNLTDRLLCGLNK